MRLEQSLPLLGLLLCVGECSRREAHGDQKGGCPGAAGEKAEGRATGFAKYLQPHLLQLACTVPMELLLSRVSVPLRVQVAGTEKQESNPLSLGKRT